ncbi:MAG: SDR family oxidoreductase [Steroidobacteraceae bacterium]
MDEKQPAEPTGVEETASDRRKFLGKIAAGAGAATLLAGVGAGTVAQAAGEPPRPHGPPGMPHFPPEPKVSQPPPLREVKGKTIYISAASGGIGLGIAQACANAGMNVVVGYRSEKRLAKAMPLFKAGTSVFPVKHDVVGRDGWVRMLDAVKGKYGKLHAVVNNAGIKTFAKASEATPEQWQKSYNVDLSAIFNSVSVVLPHMKEHGEGGQFVATSSMSGLLPAVTAGVYTTMKFAVVGIMEALRIELEGTNIGTSVFCPGGVGSENPPANFHPRVRPGAHPHFDFNGVVMSPIEAGERVLNGIRHNDLFILSHAEFKNGTMERFNAILESFPDEAFPAKRLGIEAHTRHTGIYPREIVHRLQKRKSYLG